VGYGYDSAANLTTVTDVRGKLWHYAYDANHQLLTEQDPNNNVVVTNTYDSNLPGHVRSQKDGLQNLTQYSYSASGQNKTTNVTDPRGYVTEYDYTGGQLMKMVGGVGTSSSATWSYAYDPYVLGLTTVTDPNNHTTSATYDHQGNRTSTKSALGHTTGSVYDSLNDLTAFTDGNTVQTTYTYDTRGNLTSSSTPLVGSSPLQYQTTKYAYTDPNHPGDLMAVTDPNGRVTNYTYDAAGDPASVTDPMGDKTTYTYDTLGRRQTLVSPRGNAAGANPAQYTTSYGYDNASHLLSSTDPLNHTTSYTYYDDGDLWTVTDPNGNQTTYSYNADNQVSQVTRADAAS
jgi:YD repeat-containing protein